MLNLIKKIVGTKNEREIRRIGPYIDRINSLEPAYQKLTDAELRAKTDGFRTRLQEKTAGARAALENANTELAQATGEEREELKSRAEELDKELRQAESDVLEEILPEAFAAVREASRRSIGLRHFDVQLIGGVVLHEGKIAEMKTGEGKTLVATLALYLNALTGRGVHLITVNDYLARRDVQWMGPIYHKLGLSVASIVHDTSYVFDPAYLTKDYRYLNLRPVTRQQAYLADITYGTNNEFGFDYLRDNMKFSLDEYVQRELNFAVVDEVDNILIDEARTPLIISGPAEESTDKYYIIDRIIPKLQRGAVIQGDPSQDKRAAIEAQGDYTVDEKSRSVTLTESGVAKVERLLGVHNLYDPRQIDTLHHVQQALKAHAIFKRDVDYVVKDGEVIIVDEFTGRLMPGRRWSDGLHQAVEAKERVHIREENQTLATITIQNYFRMYKKLAGMTGTADTEAPEFKKIYKLDVVVVPTHRTMIRTDHADVVYRTEAEKFNAVVEEIEERHKKGQPILVGTTSVAKSERVSRMLKKKGIKHNVLNAVNHEAEASIIAQAGRFGAVTIATNMAGRGTDILLGGNPDFLARSDMENEWITRAAKLPVTGASRYEDALRELREKYDEEVQRAEKRYVAEAEVFQQQRSEALKRATDLQRQIREISPFRELRRTYEDLSATELIEALHGLRAVPESYLNAKTDLESSLASALDGAPSEERAAFENAREEFNELIVRWQERDGDRRALVETLDEKRRNYEQRLSELEFEAATIALGAGESAELVGEYQQAHQAFEEAEARCEEIRHPYEEALQAAQRSYETKRQEYLRLVEEIREQLDKAPDEYRHRFDELLSHYNQICAEERERVIAAGGLHILGTERHESRRIDNQLRGRAGRQGDPGSSRFYLSLEDDLMRIFGADRIQGIMSRLGMEEGVPIEHGLVTRAIENAQKKVEAHNFDIRKHLLEYDDVMNKQREVIYNQRREVLKGENLKEQVLDMAQNLVDDIVAGATSKELHPSDWDLAGLRDAFYRQFNLRLDLKPEEQDGLSVERILEIARERVVAAYEDKEKRFGEPMMRQLEKIIMLQTIDTLWKDHLLNMDHLKEGIGLRGYGQKNPLQEYQKEGFELFEEMIHRIQEDVVQKLFTVEIARESAVERMEVKQQPQRMVLSHGGAVENRPTAPKRQGEKVGRNDPCPCGSGKKYKRCCGK
ncbi:MAG TPA: preprotein translocase subunit SecA [Candidatus Eisenbacteria bacterium]|nr:preprotein translocase subunit SecA [Candidatus Eisenbacteria bacterium]